MLFARNKNKWKDLTHNIPRIISTLQSRLSETELHGSSMFKRKLCKIRLKETQNEEITLLFNTSVPREIFFIFHLRISNSCNKISDRNSLCNDKYRQTWKFHNSKKYTD